MSSPAAIANHTPVSDQSPEQRHNRFDPANPGILVRERWKYSKLATFVEAQAEASSPDALRIEPASDQGLQLKHLGTDAAQLSNAALSDSKQWQAYPLADSIFSGSNGWLATISPDSTVAAKLSLADGQGHGLVHVGAAASAHLALDLASSGAALAVLQFELAANATLTLDTTALDVDGLSWLLSRFTLHEHARLTLRQYFAGAGTHRHETHVTMAGAGAEADLSGAAIGQTGSRFDQQLVMEHTAAHANSNQRYHCVGLAKSKTNFSGRIHIHPGARQTVAQLSNRNLALANSAELNTKPELEIYNDDVRCAHGATVGQLDPEALYYCQSRGIGTAAAKALLTSGFLQQCVSGPNADRVSQVIRERIA